MAEIRRDPAPVRRWIALVVAVGIIAGSADAWAAKRKPRKPWFRAIGSGLCLVVAKAADDQNATAGWATLGIGLGVWAVLDYWVVPSLDKSNEFPPARTVPHDPADDPLRMFFGASHDVARPSLVMETPLGTP